jgi:hypothetical protein
MARGPLYDQILYAPDLDVTEEIVTGKLGDYLGRFNGHDLVGYPHRQTISEVASIQKTDAGVEPAERIEHGVEYWNLLDPNDRGREDKASASAAREAYVKTWSLLLKRPHLERRFVYITLWQNSLPVVSACMGNPPDEPQV